MGKRDQQPVYLDFNVTTPHAPEVVAAIRPFLEEHFGNPSSAHRFGAVTRAAIVEARSQVAGMLNAQPHEIVFTSGGTESNNYAIRGTALACRQRGRHIITSQIEHPAVTEVCRQLQDEGFEVTWLPVDEHGLVDIVEVEAAIRPDTIWSGENAAANYREFRETETLCLPETTVPSGKVRSAWTISSSNRGTATRLTLSSESRSRRKVEACASPLPDPGKVMLQ